jgi:aerotaxis receptor
MTAAPERILDVSIETLIVSRTDQRGVIASVNDDFQAISGFPLDELIDAPHKVVRHPDMPKGLFHLLWDRLKAGEPIAAYIKNRCKDGDAYWVLATITPLDDGYMSMRIRPKQDDIAAVTALYSELRQSEKDGDLTPAQSADRINDAAIDMGFAHYKSYIAQKLAHEITARDAHFVRPVNQHLASSTSLMQEWKSAWTDCDDILTSYEAFDLKPMNMRIQSGHLKAEGVALNVIASNFAAISGEINAQLTSFADAMTAVTETILDCLFLINVQSLIAETISTLRKEGRTEDAEIAVFVKQSAIYTKKISHGGNRALQSITEFVQATETIKRQLSALSVTRVMCAIEVAQLKNADGTDLSAIIDDLDQFQEAPRIKLGDISRRLIRMQTTLVHQRSNAAA